MLVDLFVFEAELRITTHDSKGSFAQVIFEETVAGFDEAGVLSLKGTGRVLRPRKIRIPGECGVAVERLMSPISARIPAE